MPLTVASVVNRAVAKGDLLVAPGPNALVRLPVGADDQVLTADAAETVGVKWAAAAAGGFTGAVCRVKLSADTGAANPMPFDAEEFDPDGLHDNATNPSRITVATTGYYEASWLIRALDTITTLIVKKSGSNNSPNYGALGANAFHYGAYPLQLNAGQYVELNIGLASSDDVVAGSWFALKRIA